MKKFLLLASAGVMVAAGSASAMEKGLELGIEGYSSSYFVYANQDDSPDTGSGTPVIDRSETGLRREVELDFTGEVTLDNGVTVETQQLQDDGGQESYAFVEGGYGKVIVGQEYNAAYLLQVAAPAVDAEFDGMDPTYNILSVGGSSVTDQSYDMSAQGVAGQPANQPIGDKVTYISPVWEGLQLGASYTPDQSTVASRGELANRVDEAIAVGARWGVEFWDADWTFGAGWNKTAANADTVGNDENYEQWNAAFTSEFGAWDLGVAYYGTDFDSNAGVNLDEVAVAAGVNYETGNFNYGLSYLYKEAGDDDDLNRITGGVNYSYGPGMTLNGSVSYNDYSADASIDENEATVVAIATVINF